MTATTSISNSTMKIRQVGTSLVLTIPHWARGLVTAGDKLYLIKMKSERGAYKLIVTNNKDEMLGLVRAGGELIDVERVHLQRDKYPFFVVTKVLPALGWEKGDRIQVHKDGRMLVYENISKINP